MRSLRKKKTAPLLDRLQEFRKQKEEQKKNQVKTKRPPWRAGLPQNFDFTFKKEVMPNTRRETFTGKPRKQVKIYINQLQWCSEQKKQVLFKSKGRGRR